MLCNLCKIDVETLVKSHIFPNKLCKLALDDSDIGLRFIHSKDKFYKKAPSGGYSEIVCNECENIFGPYDNHAIHFFKKLEKLINKNSTETSKISCIVPNKDFNFHLLKMFFMSLLWRTNISEHKICDYVIIGDKHEKRLANLIQNNDDGELYEYTIHLIYYPKSQKFIGSPLKRRIEQVNFYSFFILNFEILIKCDERPDPYDGRVHTLNSNRKYSKYLHPEHPTIIQKNTGECKHQNLFLETCKSIKST